VQEQQNIAARLSSAVIHLAPSAALGSENFDGELPADFYGSIVAAAVDDDDFMRRQRAERLQRRRDGRFFV
jgi:hypothetical protein